MVHRVGRHVDMRRKLMCYRDTYDELVNVKCDVVMVDEKDTVKEWLSSHDGARCIAHEPIGDVYRDKNDIIMFDVRNYKRIEVLSATKEELWYIE